MTWKSFHHRGEILRSVIATCAVRRDGLLPMDVDGVRETFGDELTLLAALQLTWHTRLTGHVERQLADQPLDLPQAVEAAWGAAADQLAGVRAVLDHYRSAPLDEPMRRAMTTATAKEHQMLAVMAGGASVGDRTGIAVGAALEERARAGFEGRPVVAQDLPRPSLLGRLKAVIAA